MAFTLAFMPKTFSPLPSFKTYLQQQPRKRTVVCTGQPQRPKPSSGKGGKINRDQMMTSLNSSQSTIKDQLEMKPKAKESDGSPNKAKASQ
ncbi:hypothetical protein OWV82_005192 [Melia azedarach]|uniref:Uncharacterized protein n=1 Tax=Melia azedarach TaxID=155640 RepID=A0ACC1YTI2_MELAZ|nr:hypothetical protein OWV82_005192 [Melia azedarach]